VEFHPPQDWNGQDWRCVEILWPNSTKWLALLAGLLSELQFAKVWAGNASEGQAAQDIAWAIWWANQPFTDCGAQSPDTPTIPPIGPTMPTSGGMEIGDFEMPCIDISNLLKIENGKLYARDACCEWIEIGNLAAASEPITDPFANPEDPPTYTACGKAASVMEITETVAEAVWDCLALTPNQWVGHVKNAAPGWHLGTPQIYLAVGDATATSLIHGENVVFGANAVQEMLCSIEPFFTADGQAIRQDEFYNIKGAIRAVWNGRNQGVVGGFWVACMDVLGLTDISNAAISGATIAADCDCPQDVAPRPVGDETVIYDIIASLTPVTVDGTLRHLVCNNSYVRLFEDPGHNDQAEELSAVDIDPGVSFAVSADDLVVWALFGTHEYPPVSEVWLEVGLNIHHDGSDTVMTARHEAGIVGSYVYLIIENPPAGEVTSVYITGKLWTNEGMSADFKILDWFVTQP